MILNKCSFCIEKSLLCSIDMLEQNLIKLISEEIKSTDFLQKANCIKCNAFAYYSINLRKVQADISISQAERAGGELIKSEGLKDIQSYYIAQIEKFEAISKNEYVLPWTIENHNCNTEEICPTCNGKCDCPDCHGERYIECPVCEGDKICPECDGEGSSVCFDCNGTGECSRCDHGHYHCRKCHGEGYVNTKSGTKECSKCHGHGSVECWTCGGSGVCRTCGGEGTLECRYCYDTGICGKCQGRGSIKCTTCQASGFCPRCKGRGKIVCRRCLGTGVYQSFQTVRLDKTVECFNITSHPLTFQGLLDSDMENIFDESIIEVNPHNITKQRLDKFYSKIEPHHLQNIKGEIIDILNNEDSETYCNIEGLIRKIPVVQHMISYAGKCFNIYILTNSGYIYYDKLPSFYDRLKSKILSRFTRKH
ncbi:MAG: hypothetical protein NC391_04660 [Alistipes timonensis]|nr:hypothetical protein [Alistipes timonensis]